MTKQLEEQFYFGAVIDHDGECQRVSDEEAQFWTVYERNADGLSSAICDCTHRNDAVAATERFNALIAALEQSEKLKETFRVQSNMFCADANELKVRVEDLESQRKMAFMASNRWADKFRGAEKRIAELESCGRIEYTRRLERKVAELEASQLAVKLPEVVSFDDLDVNSKDREIIEAIANCKGWNAAIAEAQRMNAAGITVQGDE